MEDLQLVPGQFGSIFIRRGDKMIRESKFISSEKYLCRLLKEYPECHTVFLQTDDYQAYEEIQDYIQKKHLAIRLVTLCEPQYRGGMIIYQREHHHLEKISCPHKENLNFLEKNKNQLRETVPIENRSADEKRKHMATFLVGIEIVCRYSVYCTSDFQSNVARFIKLHHSNPQRVINILNQHPEPLDHDLIEPWNSWRPLQPGSNSNQLTTLFTNKSISSIQEATKSVPHPAVTPITSYAIRPRSLVITRPLKFLPRENKS
jgi:hypothetical protein